MVISAILKGLILVMLLSLKSKFVLMEKKTKLLQECDQAEQIETLEGAIESRKTLKQAEANEILENEPPVEFQDTTEEWHAFEVLQFTGVEYRGHFFYAFEVKVPADGQSKSLNWCYDYQYLCESYGSRPTGCGRDSDADINSCYTTYESYNDLRHVLGCDPSKRIAEVANIAFPNLSPPAQEGINAFGFFRCNECNKTLQVTSENALAYMRGFWQSNMTTFYTVCR